MCWWVTQVEENELKMDRKIEMLSRTGAFGGDEDNEDTDEMSDMNDVESSLVCRKYCRSLPAYPDVICIFCDSF